MVSINLPFKVANDNKYFNTVILCSISSWHLRSYHNRCLKHAKSSLVNYPYFDSMIITLFCGFSRNTNSNYILNNRNHCAGIEDRLLHCPQTAQSVHIFQGFGGVIEITPQGMFSTKPPIQFPVHPFPAVYGVVDDGNPPFYQYPFKFMGVG